MTGPIALKSAAGGALAEPGDQGGKPVKGRPKLDRVAGPLRPAPASGGSKAGNKRGAIAFQFNPKEVTIAKTAKWERKTTKGSKKAGPRVQRGGAVQAHPGDVLRRHEHPGRLRGPSGRAAVPAAASRRRRARGRSRRRRSWCCTGARSPASRRSSPRSAPSTPCSTARACRSGRWSAWPWRRCPASRSGRTRPRAARTSAGCTGPSPATPGLGRVRRVRRPDAVAGAGRVQRHRRPAARPHRHHPAAARPGRAGRAR